MFVGESARVNDSTWKTIHRGGGNGTQVPSSRGGHLYHKANEAVCPMVERDKSRRCYAGKHIALKSYVEYHEALLLSVNVQAHLTSSFADDGNASWYSVCRVPMVKWRLDCEDCRHRSSASMIPAPIQSALWPQGDVLPNGRNHFTQVQRQDTLLKDS